MVHLHIQGNLEAETANAIDRTVTSCVAGGQLLVVHLRELEYATTEGLGALLDARQRLLATGLSLTLAGVPARMKLLFSAWCLEPLFDEFRLEREELAFGKKVRQAARFATLVEKDASLPVESEG
jgi:anti-anti-sigma factor